MMRYFLILFFIALCWTPSHCDNTQYCKDFVQGLKDKNPNFDINTLTPQEKYWYLYSGRGGAFDFGSRVLCDAQSSMTYFVIFVDAEGGADVHPEAESGLCIAKECIAKIIRSTPGMIDDLFMLNHWGIPLGVGKLHSLQETPPKTGWFWFSAFLHAILMLLVLVTTIVAIVRRRRKNREIKDQAGKSKPEKLQWLVDAFDMYGSLKSLWATAADQKQNENLSIFGFVRVIGCWWVIGTHAIGVIAGTSRFSDSVCNKFCKVVVQGTYAVGIFFYMGGFLAVYVLVAKLQSQNLTVMSMISAFKHRWMRIWPLTIMATIFYWLVLPYLVNGPMMGRYWGASAACNKFWWQKLLLLDNYLTPRGPGCAVWTWYVSVDIQSYLFVVLIVFCYTRARLAGYIVCAICFYHSWRYSIDSVKDPFQFYTYYINSESRASEIFVGVFVGLHYYDYAKKNIKLNAFWICEKLWIVKYGIIIGGCYLFRYVLTMPDQLIIPKNWSVNGRLYICLATAFTFGPIAVKTSNFLKDLLNLRVFQLLGKLAFGGYLFHLPVMNAMRDMMNDLGPRVNPHEIKETMIKTIVITFSVSLFYYIITEKPIGAIEAHFLKRKSKEEQKEFPKIVYTALDAGEAWFEKFKKIVPKPVYTVIDFTENFYDNAKARVNKAISNIVNAAMSAITGRFSKGKTNAKREVPEIVCDSAKIESPKKIGDKQVLVIKSHDNDIELQTIEKNEEVIQVKQDNDKINLSKNKIEKEEDMIVKDIADNKIEVSNNNEKAAL